MLLGSITTGPPIPEHGTDARGSQVTPGTGRKFYLGLGQPYRCFPSRDAQEISRYLSRHLTQSAQATMDEALCAVLREDLQSSCPCPGNRSAGLPHSSATLSQSALQHSPALPSCSLASPQHQARERQEELEPPTGKGDFWALISGLSGECRNPGSFHHLRRAPVTGDRRCFVVFKPPSDS